MKYHLIKFCFCIIAFMSANIRLVAQHELNNKEHDVKYDTKDYNVFDETDSVSFKLNYFHTEGYSSYDRYSYEVIILDTLLILNFNAPDNDDWNYVSYQKHVFLHDSTLNRIKTKIKTFKIGQKKKGIPIPQGSGYGADKLFIESKDVSVAGGVVYMNIGPDFSRKNFLKRVKKEKDYSSSISGDYEAFFHEIESLFIDLPLLMMSMEK